MKQTILNILICAICALAGTTNTAQAASKTVSYTLDGTWEENFVVNLTATASGGATGTYSTSWNFQTDVTPASPSPTASSSPTKSN